MKQLDSTLSNFLCVYKVELQLVLDYKSSAENVIIDMYTI